MFLCQHLYYCLNNSIGIANGKTHRKYNNEKTTAQASGRFL